jgi:hypothetical protein
MQSAEATLYSQGISGASLTRSAWNFGGFIPLCA